MAFKKSGNEGSDYSVEAVYKKLSGHDIIENAVASFRFSASTLHYVGKVNYRKYVDQALASNGIPFDFKNELRKQALNEDLYKDYESGFTNGDSDG